MSHGSGSCVWNGPKIMPGDGGIVPKVVVSFV